jgi:hypothetical protein
MRQTDFDRKIIQFLRRRGLRDQLCAIVTSAISDFIQPGTEIMRSRCEGFVLRFQVTDFRVRFYYTEIIDPWTLTAIALVLTAVAAYASWMLVEKPSLNLLRKPGSSNAPSLSALAPRH